MKSFIQNLAFIRFFTFISFTLDRHFYTPIDDDDRAAVAAAVAAAGVDSGLHAPSGDGHDPHIGADKGHKSSLRLHPASTTATARHRSTEGFAPEMTPATTPAWAQRRPRILAPS
jgi:hypothetical protein